MIENLLWRFPANKGLALSFNERFNLAQVGCRCSSERVGFSRTIANGQHGSSDITSNDPIGQNYIAADARRTPKFDHERVINATIINIFNGGAGSKLDHSILD